MQPIIIVGSGMAGYTLAREYRKLNPEQELIMICADDGINYAKPTLSNALVGKKAPEQIALGDAAKMSAQLNMSIKTQTQVVSINAEQHVITVETNGQTSEQNYSKLVLAVGANQIRLNIAGDGAEDILVVNTLAEYKQFRDHLDQRAQKRVLILGAGLIGCEFANDLKATEHEVIVVDVAPQVLGRLLPQQVSEEFKTKLEQAGIQFVLGTTINTVNRVNAQEYQVELSNGETHVVDVVLSAVGLKPSIELAQQADILTGRGIIANTLLETSQADIYALGDCVEINGTLLPYVMPIMQQARALAKTLAGETTHLHYPAMPVAVKTPAAPLTVLPVPQDVNVQWSIEQLEDGMIAQATDAENTLRGFVLLGATAGKQRLTLAKQVPDLIPAQV